MKRLIGTDTGTDHALAWCRSCPPWREIRGTRAAALLAAADHLARCHGDDEAAAALRYRARQATYGTPHPGRRGNPKVD